MLTGARASVLLSPGMRAAAPVPQPQPQPLPPQPQQPLVGLQLCEAAAALAAAAAAAGRDRRISCASSIASGERMPSRGALGSASGSSNAGAAGSRRTSIIGAWWADDGETERVPDGDRNSPSPESSQPYSDQSQLRAGPPKKATPGIDRIRDRLGDIDFGRVHRKSTMRIQADLDKEGDSLVCKMARLSGTGTSMNTTSTSSLSASSPMLQRRASYAGDTARSQPLRRSSYTGGSAAAATPTTAATPAAPRSAIHAINSAAGGAGGRPLSRIGTGRLSHSLSLSGGRPGDASWR